MSIDYVQRVLNFKTVSECEIFKSNAQKQNRQDLVELADKRSLELQSPSSGGFTTYENTANPHTTIHKSICSQIRKNGGIHKYGNGQYRDHETFEAAFGYATKTNLPVKNCSFCQPV